MPTEEKLALIGAGNIGLAIARGLTESKLFTPERIILTRRSLDRLEAFAAQGYQVQVDNVAAVQLAGVVIVAVEPQQVDTVLAEIAPALDPARHSLISVVSGITTSQISARIGDRIPVVRAMPNTAIAIGESITCLAAPAGDSKALQHAMAIFDTVGQTLVIEEEQMAAATALGACGIAFFLRAIRAASQGGIEIGFHSDKALQIAAQTARGAATLLLVGDNHPEHEIDRVTTPRGVTISGLNQMEHEGLSSAMIKGIVVSAEKAAKLYSADND